MRLSLHCGSDQICRYLKNWPAGRSPGSKLKEIVRIVFMRIGNGPGANTSALLIAGFENTLFLQSTHGENKTTLPTIQTMASDLGYTEPPWFRSTSEPVVMRRRQTMQKHIYFIIYINLTAGCNARTTLLSLQPVNFDSSRCVGICWAKKKVFINQAIVRFG